MGNMSLFFKSLVVVYAAPGNDEFSGYKFPLSLSSEDSRAQPRRHPYPRPSADLEFKCQNQNAGTK